MTNEPCKKCECLNGVRAAPSSDGFQIWKDCPCPCHKEESVRNEAELDLEEAKVIFDVRLYESHEFYSMKEVGIRFIKEVERLQGEIELITAPAEITWKILRDENATLQDNNDQLKVCWEAEAKWHVDRYDKQAARIKELESEISRLNAAQQHLRTIR